MYSLIEYLMNVAPIVVVMGVIIIVLWKQYNETVQYARKMDKENLDTLKDLSAVLEKVLESDKVTEQNVITQIEKSALEMKIQIQEKMNSINKN